MFEMESLSLSECASRVAADLEAVRTSSPLVHSITNYVVMNNTANALLSVCASPVMAHAVEEMEEMASIASAVVLNIGTLSPEWVEGMMVAGQTASRRGIPLVLDPVGAGATSFRTRTCLDIIKVCRPTIIRGNASEVMALRKGLISDGRGSEEIRTKGVDSSAASSDAVSAAMEVSRMTGAVLSVSGATDYITDGECVMEVHNGAEIMTRVTGLGCTASALTGAFAAVESSVLFGAYAAMAVMGVAGEIAAGKSAGNGSMQVNFLDVLYNLGGEQIRRMLR